MEEKAIKTQLNCADSQAKMGSFIFTWEHPADEVYVTGTFDDWSKSERLEKTNNVFTKKVLLTNISEKIYYKFVVDGNWVTDHTAPQENDESGNLNNVLTADRITTQTSDLVVIMSGVTPESSSVPLAAAVPIEKGKVFESDTLPGTFPETPAIESGVSEFLMSPVSAADITVIPTAPTVPEFADSRSNTTPPRRNEQDPTFSVSPLPVFPGAVNPVSISPGQKIPDYNTVTTDTLTSNVDLGKEPPPMESSLLQNPSLVPHLSSTFTQYDEGESTPGISKEILKSTIPESGSAIESRIKENFNTNPIIQSVGPLSSTAVTTAGIPQIESSLLSQKNISSTILTTCPDREVTEKEEISTRNLNTSGKGFTIIEAADEIKNTTGTLPLQPASDTSDELLEVSEAVNKALESRQNLERGGNEDIGPKKEEDKIEINDNRHSTGKSASIIHPIVLGQSNPLQAVPSHTVTAVESSNMDSNIKPSDPPQFADGTNDKANKKKKRASFFGKLKAKLTFKDKD